MVHLTRRHLNFAGAAAVLGATAWPALASAQQRRYPDTAIRIVSPFAAGGATDIPARLLAQKMFDGKASIFVDNVDGAGATIGSARVAKAAPDGYTLLISNVASQGIAPGIYPTLPYDAVTGFSHIGLIGTQPNVLVVKASSPWQTLDELVKAAKATPGGLSYGSAGNGSSPHLCCVMLESRAGIKALHVPYKGTPPAVSALLAGDVQFMFGNLSALVPQVQAGALRALAVSSATRTSLLPDVKTVQEQGVPDFSLETWHGLSGPAGMPPAIVETLNAEMNKVLRAPEGRDFLLKQGLEPRPGTSAEFTAFVTGEVKKWGELVKLSGAKIG